MQRSIKYIILATLLGVVGCIDPFNPPEINNTESYLVFDGFIQANGSDTSWVTLSRTQNLHDFTEPLKETGAKVQVENQEGFIYYFQPHVNKAGTYFLPPTTFHADQKHSLAISLSNGRVYQSDWEEFRISPPIDSITYEIKEKEGIQIYVNTHDPTNQSKFYKWNFNETWEYRAALASTLELIDSQVVDRLVDINRCWGSTVATHINLFTTAALSRDLVRSHPINYVSVSSNKLLLGYSIEVQQQVLTREAFDYWTELARNNETNGSIFDPFPSQLTGNIRAVDNSGEKVFGFFSGGVTQSKRIFIREGLGRYEMCQQIDTLSFRELFNTSYLIVNEILETPGNYVTADQSCVDCRLRGGTIQRPHFWQ